MRVTDGMVFQNAFIDTGRAREAAERAQQVAASQTKLTHPGDDPAGAGAVIGYRVQSDRYTAIASATGAASDELSLADQALGSVSTGLSRAKQLAVQFASAGYSASQAAGAASEIDGVIGQLVAALNTQSGSRFIFGGTRDAAPPFDSTGTYSGDAGVRLVETAPGVTEQANVDAAQFIHGGAPGSVDVFAALNALKTALASGGDPTAVQATITGLDASISQVSQARTQAGTQMNVFDAAATAAKTVATDATSSASTLADADIIESSIQLQQTQTALQASLQATAQSFKLSLMNYL